MRLHRHERCKFCHEPAPSLYVALPEANVEVLRCRLCRMPFVATDYDDEEARAIYDEVLGTEADYEAFEPARSPRFRRLLDAASGGHSLEGARVLDVGAGGGGFLALAKERGAHVRGIEFSGTARRFALEHHDVLLSEAALDDASWDEGGFDLITIWDLAEHLPDPAGTLRRAASLLAPGGRLALTTPSRKGALHAGALGLARLTRGRLSVAARHRYNLLHLQIFRPADLGHLLGAARLDVLCCEQIADFSYPGSWYLRTARIPTSLARALGPLADAWLEHLPPRNKLLAVARRAAA